VLANDWEIEEEPITITMSQYLDTMHEFIAAKYSGRYDPYYTDIASYSLIEFGRKLGILKEDRK
jgi:hypothetical protein